MKPTSIQLCNHFLTSSPYLWLLLKALALDPVLMTNIILYCSYYPDSWCVLYCWSFWERAYLIRPIRKVNLVPCFVSALIGKWTGSSIFNSAQIVMPGIPAPRIREPTHISAERTMRAVSIIFSSSNQDTEAPRDLIFYPMSQSELVAKAWQIF